MNFLQFVEASDEDVGKNCIANKKTDGKIEGIIMIKIGVNSYDNDEKQHFRCVQDKEEIDEFYIF